MKYMLVYCVFFILSVLATVTYYFSTPNCSVLFFDEDGLIENISAFLYLISFVMGIYFFLNGSNHRKSQILISGISLTGFLDEISFGERLFKLEMPQIYGVKIDGAHDLFFLAAKVTKELTLNHFIYVILFLLTGTVLTIFFLYINRIILLNLFTDIIQKRHCFLVFFL